MTTNASRPLRRPSASNVAGLAAMLALLAACATPGPTPVLDGSDLPASAAQLDTELTGFELLDPAVAAS